MPGAAPRQAGAQGAGAGALMALLPVVLAMLNSRGGGANAGDGGLGGMLGQMLGGGAGGRGSGLDGMLGQMMGGGSGAGRGGSGGLGDLLGRLEQAGYGEQARSWVSTGQNLPLSPDAIGQIFGGDGLAQIARQAGLSEQDASAGLSSLLPEVVDHLTPNGALPEQGMFADSIADLQRRLGG